MLLLRIESNPSLPLRTMALKVRRLTCRCSFVASQKPRYLDLLGRCLHTCTHFETGRDALTVMDSQLVIRVESMVTTSSLEVIGADLDGTRSNYLRLVLLILLSLLLVA